MFILNWRILDFRTLLYLRHGYRLEIYQFCVLAVPFSLNQIQVIVSNSTMELILMFGTVIKIRVLLIIVMVACKRKRVIFN